MSITGTNTPIKDNGERMTFVTGSTRSPKTGKGRYDLLPWDAIQDVAIHYEKGAVLHGDRNWEKGQPISTYLSSAARHLGQAIMGETDEPHAVSAVWNLLCYLQTMKWIERGVLPGSLNDMPGPRQTIEGKVFQRPAHLEPVKPCSEHPFATACPCRPYQIGVAAEDLEPGDTVGFDPAAGPDQTVYLITGSRRRHGVVVPLHEVDDTDHSIEIEAYQSGFDEGYRKGWDDALDQARIGIILSPDDVAPYQINGRVESVNTIRTLLTILSHVRPTEPSPIHALVSVARDMEALVKKCDCRTSSDQAFEASMNLDPDARATAAFTQKAAEVFGEGADAPFADEGNPGREFTVPDGQYRFQNDRFHGDVIFVNNKPVISNKDDGSVIVNNPVYYVRLRNEVERGNLVKVQEVLAD